ncbi:MAG: TonB-dependent receptor [Gemmatimonadaceae bacterium]
MSTRGGFITLWSSLRAPALALSLAATPVATALAQNGRIAGTVADSAGAPLTGAQVLVVGTAMRAMADDAGRFAIGNVTPGSYDLRAQRIGQRAQTVSGVVVRSGEETRVSITLARAPLELAGIVVSASRRAEKVTDAPATVSRIEASAIENTVGNSFAPALKEVKGLDFIQLGVTSVAANARGFNSAFNNRMLLMEDNRIAVLPENGLPVGAFTTIPKVDLAGIEVLVGPGSALYGPDASNGVITLETKDPRDYPGTTVEAAVGSRNFYDLQLRHAGLAGERFGYKVAGEYLQANDWENRNIYAPISAAAAPSPEIGADFDTDVVRGSGALVYYFPSAARLELSGGASKSNAIGMTNVGRNQLIDWEYRQGQLRFSHPNWFAQVYHALSLSGDTYQLNGFAQNRLRFPSLSDDSVKSLSAFPARGQLTAAEVQNSFSVSALNDTRFTLGAQYRHDRVTSKRRWLVDRKTGEDIEIDQKGVYGQIEVPLTTWLRTVVAGRYDKHDYYDAQFSPKAAVLVSPVPDHTFRVTFNRAFKSPTVLQTSFFFPDFQPFVGVFGNRNGYVIRNSAGETVRTIAPIEPETNDTWEVGYKGVLGGTLYLDATGYYSDFDNFMSPLVIIANFLTPPAAGGPTFAFDARTNERLTGATGGPQIPLTYYNVGRAKIYGTDIGLRWLLTPAIAVSGTTSLQKLDKVESNATDPVEATAFNSPTTKITVGMDFAELPAENLSGGFTVRYVNGYSFLSGVNVGRIPTFTTFDFTLGYGLPRLGSRLNLSVQNLFSCRSGKTTANGFIAAGRPAVYTENRECGFGKKHAEMLNNPEIGTMVFLGIRWER